VGLRKHVLDGVKVGRTRYLWQDCYVAFYLNSSTTCDYMLMLRFCADLNESPTDDTTDASTSSPQKGKLVIDTARESSGTSTELIGSSTSETEIASDWTELAGISSKRKLQEKMSHATQVSHAVLTYL